MASDTFRIALVGAGGITGAHVGACKASEGRVAVTAVADPNTDAGAKVAGQTGATPFATDAAMFDAIKAGSVQVDGVVVCTPPNARIPIVERAMKLNLGILVEKPIAHRLQDAQKLAKMAEGYANIAAVGYCHRFVPAIEQMKRLMLGGQIGHPIRFENTFVTYFPAQKDRWMSDTSISGGGSFMDTGCHSLDLFLYFIGAPKLEGMVKDFAWPERGESGATAIVRWNRDDDDTTTTGIAGVIVSGWLEPDRFTVKLVGTEGSLFYDYLKPKDLVFVGTDGKSETLDVESHELRFLRQLIAFSNAVRGDKRAPLASFADALITAEVIDAANK